MNRTAILALGTVAGLAALVLAARRASAAIAESGGLSSSLDTWFGIGAATEAPPIDPSWADEAMTAETFTTAAPRWNLPAAGEPYRAAIEAAEDRYGIPRMLLGRLLYQESRFRQDIISGRVKSSAGAIGIAQFMPATAAEWGVDPYNAESSIDGAGRYLAALYRRFGNWSEALASYNWGQGNVSRKGLGSAPLETRNYVSQILGDTGYA